MAFNGIAIEIVNNGFFVQIMGGEDGDWSLDALPVLPVYTSIEDLQRDLPMLLTNKVKLTEPQ